MANVLFLTRKDLMSLTPLEGNIDEDKWRYSVLAAQDMELELIIGSRLYEKLKDDVLGSNLTGKYKELVDSYIKRYLAYMVASEYVNYGGYRVANGGTFRHEPETGTPASASESARLSNLLRKKADYYGGRMVDFICANSNSFPEYYQHNTGDVSKSNDNTSTQWLL